MFSKLLFGNDSQTDTVMDSFNNDIFKEESEWLTNRRKELINNDKLTHNKMLINNPTREVTLRGATVL